MKNNYILQVDAEDVSFAILYSILLTSALLLGL